MKELEELLVREWLVPADFKTRIVYHYTSAAGLIGILSSGVIRGTNASFLNDVAEIEYGLAVCLEVLAEERTARTSSVEKRVLDCAIEWMRDDTLPDEVYIASFSARHDLLSQWRGYGSADGRFCIGFQLSQFSEREILQLPRPVEYSRQNQREQVKQAIAIACRAALASGEESSRAGGGWVTSLAFHLRRIMCTFKHPGFAEEEEWRSVTTISPVDDLRAVQFEVFKGMPRPYVIMLAGSRTSAQLPVTEVCIGHADRKRAAYRATGLLLSRCGYPNVKVTETEIPFSG